MYCNVPMLLHSLATGMVTVCSSVAQAQRSFASPEVLSLTLPRLLDHSRSMWGELRVQSTRAPLCGQKDVPPNSPNGIYDTTLTLLLGRRSKLDAVPGGCGEEPVQH